MAERIRLSRAKGWRLSESAVNVARPGKWGNPFIVGQDGTREQCVALFAHLTRGFIDFGGRLSIDEQLSYYRRVRRRIADLQGHDLACWCALDGKPCHADILLNLANGTPLPSWAKEPIDIGRVRIGMAAWYLEKAARKARHEKRHPTAEQIEAAKSPRGGWSRETLAQWGVPWPPPRGWKAALLDQHEGPPA